jgi:CheY-like chemotaxis protein
MPDGRDGRVVLIVQEELVIRMDVVEAFETGGFKIFQADTAEMAIDVLQREPTIRVVFTDVDLPGTMDGLTLAHYVRHRWPPTILLVGSARIPGKALPSKTHFVQQPYLDGGLAQAVKEVSSQIEAA